MILLVCKDNIRFALQCPKACVDLAVLGLAGLWVLLLHRDALSVFARW